MLNINSISYFLQINNTSQIKRRKWYYTIQNKFLRNKRTYKSNRASKNHKARFRGKHFIGQ